MENASTSGKLIKFLKNLGYEYNAEAMAYIQECND
jgi:hypothetical protein